MTRPKLVAPDDVPAPTGPRAHEELILNWFRAKGTMSSGVVEGLNYPVKLTMRKAYGFRDYEATEVALYQRLGKLPE